MNIRNTGDTEVFIRETCLQLSTKLIIRIKELNGCTHLQCHQLVRIICCLLVRKVDGRTKGADLIV